MALTYELAKHQCPEEKSYSEDSVDFKKVVDIGMSRHKEKDDVEGD